MPINITDEFHAATTKGKIASAKEVFLTGDTENLQQIGEKTHQLEDSIKNIAATGGASTAAAVTFDNAASGMTAVNAQGAIEELNTKNKTQDTELAKKANATEVISQMQTEQKRVDTELGKKANIADVNTKINEEKLRVDGELGKKLAKTDIVQKLGDSEDKVVSQKVVNSSLSEISNAIDSFKDNVKVKEANDDIAFSDEKGNAIARFNNGHIITEKFNSVNSITKEETISEISNAIDSFKDNVKVKEANDDIAFSDEKGNAIARFNNGHIITEKFNSADSIAKEEALSEEIIKIQNLISKISKDAPVVFNLNYTGGSAFVWKEGLDIKENSIVEITISTDTNEGGVFSIRRIVSGVKDTNDFVQLTTDTNKKLYYKFLNTENITGLGVYASTKSGNGVARFSVNIKENNSFKRRCWSFLNTDMSFTCTEQDPLPKPSSWTEWIYSQYDALMSNYPEYITKIDCDAEVMGAGIEQDQELLSRGLKTYIYHFSPKLAPNSAKYEDSDTVCKRFKVLIITGTHAEYIAIVDTLNMMKLICNNWQNNPMLEELRHTVDFYIMPCHSPSSVEDSTYANLHGVNMNRNAPVINFKVQGEGTVNYTGTKMAYETKILKYYVEKINPHIAIDHHNANRNNKNKFLYFTSMFKSVNDLNGYTLMALTRKWKKERSTIFPNNEENSFGFSVLGGMEPNTIEQWLCELGIMACTYETNRAICYRDGQYTETNPKEDDSDVMTLATEASCYVITNLIKSYNILNN